LLIRLLKHLMWNPTLQFIKIIFNLKMNYIIWNPDLEIFSIFGYPIRWYGLLWAMGLMAAYSIVKILYQSNRIAKLNAEELFVYCIVGVLAGARLGHCLFYAPNYFLTSWLHFVEIFVPIRFHTNGGFSYIGYAGLASHGGVVGLIIALWAYCKRYKVKLMFVLDCVALAAPFTSMAIRLGNLMNSEIVGRAADVPWAFVFERVDSTPRHPAQLYEAIFYLLVFVCGVLLYQKTKLRTSLGTGFFFGYCIASIFTFRFLIEFLKEVQVEFEQSMALDMGQLLSIPLIFVGLFFICRSFTSEHKSD